MLSTPAVGPGSRAVRAQPRSAAYTPASATSAASGDDLSEVALPVCLGVDVVVGPALYGDVAVVVGIDESQNLAIAYRSATCTEVARVRLP